ncbi:protein elicitor protein, partial [Colletotrichum scovillei]
DTMRIATVTLIALGSVAVAAPAPQADFPPVEDVLILDFSTRHQPDGAVDSVGLHITAHGADNLYCGLTGEVLLGEKYACGSSKYSFALGVRIYHRWGVASGASGYRDVPTYCHAGPLGSTVCTSQGPVSLYIDAVPKDW